MIFSAYEEHLHVGVIGESVDLGLKQAGLKLKRMVLGGEVYFQCTWSLGPDDWTGLNGVDDSSIGRDRVWTRFWQGGWADQRVTVPIEAVLHPVGPRSRLKRCDNGTPPANSIARLGGIGRAAKDN
jgi:hypothetical protein